MLIFQFLLCAQSDQRIAETMKTKMLDGNHSKAGKQTQTSKDTHVAKNIMKLCQDHLERGSSPVNRTHGA